MNLETRVCSSLVKIFADWEWTSVPFKSAAALKGEIFSFQVAYKSDSACRSLDMEIDSPLKKHIQVRTVESVPIRYAGCSFDEDIISNKTGLYPDLLVEPEWPVRTVPNLWRSFWITARIPENCKPGKYPVKITLASVEGEAKETFKVEDFTLEVLPAKLPKQKLIRTEWFHSDCLSTYYSTEAWSEKHWEAVGNFMKNAADHGINMILTPVFTPPLDTAVGGERPTVQLVDVKVCDGKYSFDFKKLKRWIDLAHKSGLEYFEISHLFTQWGAAFCPKIIANVNGKQKRIFGWDVKATSKKYQDFLNAFLPELTAFLKKCNIQKNVYFHCSDEPSINHLETYSAAVAILRKHLAGFKIFDALSNVEFYNMGLVTTPVPANNHIEPFVEAGIKNPWTYYCCGQTQKVSNRFVHMPSSRNRIMGTQLYRYDCAGFLQWGFNFYYAQYSLFPIDPFTVLDSNYAFPPGDAFMVYPGKDGMPLDSIRHEVFTEGLQDMRALRLLETKVPREKITAMLDKLSPSGKMTMEEYPRGEAAILGMREKINDMIRKEFSK